MSIFVMTFCTFDYNVHAAFNIHGISAGRGEGNRWRSNETFCNASTSPQGIVSCDITVVTVGHYPDELYSRR